jgi:hypothetical protein
MKKNNGISLIVLVITIIVIIILAGAVILSLSQNNPISTATEAKFKTTIEAYNSELALALSSRYLQDFAFNPNLFYAGPWDGIGVSTGTVKQYITSMTAADGPKYVIAQGKLEYVGSTVNEKQWATGLGITDGLILWLDGADFKNSPQTTTWVDKSGNGNNATCYTFAYNSTSGSDGAGAVAFDGTTDYALVNANFPATLTIEAWGNAINIDGRMLWSFDGINCPAGPDLFPTSSKFNLNIGDSGSNPFTNQTNYPSLNVWHHYVVVFNQSTNLGTLYIDGAFVGTAVYRNPTGPSLYIGRYDSSGYLWNGSIKGIRVYNRVLSDVEILKNYNDSK